MGSTGAYITYGVLMLIIVPIVMGYIGATFGTDVNTPISTETYQTQGAVTTGFLTDVVNGYGLFPIWLNAILFLLPVALITRGVVSLNG